MDVSFFDKRQSVMSQDVTYQPIKMISVCANKV